MYPVKRSNIDIIRRSIFIDGGGGAINLSGVYGGNLGDVGQPGEHAIDTFVVVADNCMRNSVIVHDLNAAKLIV